MKEDCETTENELNYFGSDPGAVKHGNFINYYSFHDVKERINNLHPQMFCTPVKNQLVCLDVGCNSGELTQAVYEYLKTSYPSCDVLILAVDIDSTLIERANKSNKNPNITFSTTNVMAQDDRLIIHNFLETCKIKKFDITLCFSVTMWIHLNNGDNGLLEFLKYIKIISRTIVIEVQPWKCYRNAQRRVKKSGHSFDLYQCLKIKSDVDAVIENTIAKDSHCKVYESASSSWHRKIQSFKLMDLSGNT